MKPRASLITFATGEVFERYAERMLESAADRFFAGRAEFVVLQTTPAWPYAARDRHSHILRARRRIRGEFLFLVDADLLFEGPVDEEIVADGITATLHPIMPPGTPPDGLTFERNPESAAYIPHGIGDRYYIGGILGGPRAAFFELSRKVDRCCELDGDYCPVWQDESYLNRLLLDEPPAMELDERYCAWPNRHVPDARIRALDKTPDEFRWRNSRT